MKMVRTYLGCTVLVAGLLAAPLTQIAAQTSPQHHSQLLLQLQSLLVQLATLQAELQAKQPAQTIAAAESPRHTTSQTSRFYDGDYEAIYEVRGITLVSRSTNGVQLAHIDVWNLWRTVVGTDAIRTYISQVRFYNDSTARHDAFVEQIGTSDDWIVGINLAAIDLSDDLLTESTIELFIHEYAHILFHYNYSLAETFVRTFWRPASSDVSAYVSDYAMQNSEEDFAESFTFFVLTPRPDALDRGRTKVAFFAQYNFFRDVRAAILDRLNQEW